MLSYSRTNIKHRPPSQPRSLVLTFVELFHGLFLRSPPLPQALDGQQEHGDEDGREEGRQPGEERDGREADGAGVPRLVVLEVEGAPVEVREVVGRYDPYVVREPGPAGAVDQLLLVDAPADTVASVSVASPPAVARVVVETVEGVVARGASVVTVAVTVPFAVMSSAVSFSMVSVVSVMSMVGLVSVVAVVAMVAMISPVAGSLSATSRRLWRPG